MKMGKVKRSTLLGLTLSLLFVASCKVGCTTANISSLKFSKDKDGNNETKEFSPTDTIYIIAPISNNASKVTVKFRIIAEKVEGMPENSPLPKLEASYDQEGSGYRPYILTPEPGGMRPGRYRVEVAMLYNGEQKDQKSDTFTIKGGAPSSPAATTSPPARATPTEDDMNDSDNSSPHSEH